jgi:hypothetical protein
MFANPIKGMLTALRGPKVVGPMAPEVPFIYGEGPQFASVTAVPLSEIKRTRPSSGPNS